MKGSGNRTFRNFAVNISLLADTTFFKILIWSIVILKCNVDLIFRKNF